MQMADHKIEDSTDNQIDSLVIATFLFSVFSCFIFYLCRHKWPQFNLHNLPILLFGYLMIGSPVFPAAKLLMVLFRLRISGISTLILDHVPLKLGEGAVGRITFAKQLGEFSRINLKISCHKLVYGSKGGNDTALWENSQSINPNLVEMSEGQTVIPVAFLIPADGQPSKTFPASFTKLPSEIQWQLEIKAVPQHGLCLRPKFILHVAEVTG
jgi:hypothetical protein